MALHMYMSLHISCLHAHRRFQPSPLGVGLDLSACLHCLSGGVWEEPWDTQNALDTIRKLERHWYQLDGNDPASDLLEEHDKASELEDEDEDGPPRKQLKAAVNKVCVHVACNAQPVCLVEQLQTVRSNYRGRVDQFRIKVGPHARQSLERSKTAVKPVQLSEGLILKKRLSLPYVSWHTIHTMKRSCIQLSECCRSGAVQFQFIQVWKPFCRKAGMYWPQQHVQLSESTRPA